MRIAITGGKGGTGKSTIATALSAELAKKFKVALIDVDVECPNDHIIMSIERNKVKDVKKLLPSFDLINCNKCGHCSQVCGGNAIFFVKGKYPILIPQQCNGCGACIIVCPENTIKKDKQVIGDISQGFLEFESNTLICSIFENCSYEGIEPEIIEKMKSNIQENFILISGEVEDGCEATSVVVNATRQYAKKLEKDYDFMVIDTPAGTHCNVISALMDIDLVIAVSEPTPLGAHDLELILQLIEKITKQRFEDSTLTDDSEISDYKNMIIINRSDIGDKNLIYPVANHYGVRFITEIL